MIGTVQMEALLGITKTLGVARIVLTGRHQAASRRRCGPAVPGPAKGRHGHSENGRGIAPA